MNNIKQIKLNDIIEDSIKSNSNNIYKIKLQKDKNYYVTLISKNDYEFNLIFFDINKKLIKFKDDNGIYLNDKLDVEDKNITNKQLVEYDDEIVIDENNMDLFNNLILDLINNKQNNLNNKFEIVIEFDEKELNNEENSQMVTNNKFNFNNKRYFTPEQSGEYYIMVVSNYNNKGDYSLLVNNVENLNYEYTNKIDLNSEKKIKIKDKFKSLKFTIFLIKNISYTIQSNDKLKIFIYNKNQKCISKNNIFNFIPTETDYYIIEIFSLEDNVNDKITIYYSRYYKSKNLSYDNKFEFLIKNNNLEFQPIFK